MPLPKNSKRRLKANVAFLRLLNKASAPQRKQLVRVANSEQIKSVCECAYNILRKNVHLSPKQLKKLRKYSRFVYIAADRSVPLKKKQRTIEQSGGFLPALLIPILTSILGGVASSVVERVISK